MSAEKRNEIYQKADALIDQWLHHQSVDEIKANVGIFSYFLFLLEDHRKDFFGLLSRDFEKALSHSNYYVIARTREIQDLRRAKCLSVLGISIEYYHALSCAMLLREERDEVEKTIVEYKCDEEELQNQI